VPRLGHNENEELKLSKTIKLSRLFWVLVLSQWATACVGFTPGLMTAPSSTTDVGYIYGRFTAVDPSPEFYGPPLRMGLVVSSSEHPESVTIEFVNSGSISVFAVKPGTYSLQRVVFAGQRVASTGVKETPASNAPTFRVEAGKAYYLGDFRGRVWGTFTSKEQDRLKALLDDVVSNHQKTTTDLRRAFPALENVETVQALD